VETFPRVQHTEEMVAQVQDIPLSVGGFAAGDEIVIVGGSPPGTPGPTNAMRGWRLSDDIQRG